MFINSLCFYLFLKPERPNKSNEKYLLKTVFNHIQVIYNKIKTHIKKD